MVFGIFLKIIGIDKWILNPERWCSQSATLTMPANLENSAAATGLESSVFISIPKKGNPKECSNYHTVALISHASKVMLKILQAIFNNTWNMWNVNFQIFKLVLEKAEEPEIKLPASIVSLKKQESSRKTFISAFDCLDHNKLWKNYERDGNIRPPYLSPEKSVCRSGSNNQNRWHHPYGRKRRRTKEPPDESERGEWKRWFKAQHSEN